MKQVIAYIKPHKLENVMLALHKIEGLTGISVLKMQGCGRSRKETSDAIFDEETYGLVSRLKLEIACCDDLVEQVIAAIQESAHTGLRGDGKIYLLPVLDAVRISTGDTGEMAI
ncbi:P-II family nitrogen regulator [Methylotuvimicrobium sp.]|uniref:P-II family nitrogen regulator n=1 Tax=Methylotuvimicrobium sp. TaxID=2822413 RepID=UPI003D6600FF